MQTVVGNFIRRTAKFGSAEQEYDLYCNCFNGIVVGFTADSGQAMLTRDEFMRLPPQTVKLYAILYFAWFYFMSALNYRHYSMDAWM